MTSTPAASPNTSQSFQHISVIIRAESIDDVFEVNNNTMEDAKKELEKLRKKLQRKKQATTLASVNPLTLERTLNFTQNLKEEVLAYGELFDDFLAEYTDQLDNADHFKVENNQVIDAVIAHIDGLESKAAEVKKDATIAAIEKTDDVSQEAQVAQLQDLLTRQASLDSTKQTNSAKKRASTKAAQVTADVNKLDT